MADDYSAEQAYIKQNQLTVYFEDCIRSLLEARRRPPPLEKAKIDANAFFRDYFLQVKRETHVVGREFAFVNATPYNRRAFLTQIWSKCEASLPPPTTLKEMHALMLSICPDFPYSLLEVTLQLIEDHESFLLFDYVIFLRAFQIRFIYDEFVNETQILFRSFSHRLTCHVPTGEVSIPQQDNNHRQIIYEALQKLISSNACTGPPLNILEEILLPTEQQQQQQQQLTHSKFLIFLAKNEKLTRFIGKEPTILKQPRPIQHQRSVIEPISSIQNDTKVLLASLSTPTTRISSPISSGTVLPPLPKQQTLVREKPIRQGSPASGIVQTNFNKRTDSATSFIARSSSAKSSIPMTNVIKQEISGTDSDIESPFEKYLLILLYTCGFAFLDIDCLMASSTNLDDRFNTAVKTIQNLPPHGIIQPSNLTKLTFYGLYKQVTQGQCKESRPSVFNIVARAKWEAWDRCRSMTKEQAMLAYIGEIGKIVEAMPETNEVIEFAKSVGLPSKSVDDQSLNTLSEKQQHHASVNLIDKDDHHNDPLVTNPIQTPVVDDNGSNRSLSLSSTSSLSSTISSDVDEFYDDPSCFISSDYDGIPSDYNIIKQPSPNPTRSSPHLHGSQNRTNDSVQNANRSTAESSSLPRHNASTPAIYSISSVVSDINNRSHLTNECNKETQHAILTALNKLQRDIHNILDRLNRLETSSCFLQQRELSARLESNSSSRWWPLSGFRREVIAFILLWPFVAFILMRLFLRTKISIRFRRQHALKI
ncbi:unnamed protein product [Rotaria magnacalcarata]|uniref:Centriolar satellite-associated tubulin polyglutamylase complex regulator 1 n=6 Tax=Rotaria magnacalcarata TaxID=392030 RepID=A0A815E4Q7_9BILA|nr:unnamed protein product [Rotaria magnacalcarata]CAF1302085.1 unnamed protein product [Rotaria magnacalcarata]CAF3846207.1 unnamed protein product [Rotaria magnacalcarata]CAF3848248.1 unnamed protein product [Rotaria magnacalcarata]